MPTREEILSGLTQLAHDGIAIAVAWHVVVGAALVLLLTGRLRRAHVARLVAALAASVAIAAGVAHNPFNAIVFAALAVAIIATTAHEPRGRVAVRAGAATAAGLAAIAFGWVYPHFLDGNPAAYLLAAPVGLVPCPTLSIAIGFAIVAGGGRAAWRVMLAGAGLFYAVFGIVRLGVTLDAGLLVAAVVLLWSTRR